MFIPLPPGLENFICQYENALNAPRKISLSSELLTAPKPEDALSALGSVGAYSPFAPRMPPGLELQAPMPAVGDLLMACARKEEASGSARKAVARPAAARPVASEKKYSEEEISKVTAAEQTPTLNDEALWGLPEWGDDAELEAILKPVLQDILGRSNGKAAAGDASVARWWTQLQDGSPLLCPLTRFPISLLPYPPFKLRVDPRHSSPHRLVDGKFLAMQCIVTGQFMACGRKLQPSDITALDDYVHRCKLGQYRPGRAAALAKDASSAASAELRSKAAQELERFVVLARAEIGKLRRIQENRLLQINKVLPAHAQALLKGPRVQQPEKDSPPKSSAKTSLAGRQGRSTSDASTTSTRVLSFCSDSSDASLSQSDR